MTPGLESLLASFGAPFFAPLRKLYSHGFDESGGLVSSNGVPWAPMRFLVLDDSGKPEATHPSRVLAFGGFSIEQANWHAVVRQVTGAKAAYFPRRGHPNEWEIKSRDFLTPNAWNRATNRRFCHEVVDILRRNGCSVYAVHCRKANARKPLHQEWLIPRCFQVLAAKFACELTSIAPTKGGLITCDWSTYHMDRHVSDCVQTFVLAHQITTIVGGVTYGSSRSLVTIQVADLIAGAFRIYNEGGAHLLHLVQDLNSLEWQRIGEVDVMRYPARSVFQLF